MLVNASMNDPLSHRTLLRILVARLKNNIPPRIGTRNGRLLLHEWMHTIQDYKHLTRVDNCTDRHLKATIVSKRMRQYCDMHKPLSYILGSHPFLDLKLKCRRPVLIPRWETEEWTSRLISLIGNKALSVVDLGCGTGAIGLAISKHCTNASVTCVDMHPKAIALTRHNSISNNCDIQMLNRSFETVEQQFDMIVCNPPYIQYGTRLPPSVRLWEDPRALYTDGIKSFEQVLNSFHPPITDPSLPRFVFEVGGRSRRRGSCSMQDIGICSIQDNPG